METIRAEGHGDPAISTQLASRGDKACVRAPGRAVQRCCPVFRPCTATSVRPTSRRRKYLTLCENAVFLNCCYYSRAAKRHTRRHGWSAQGCVRGSGVLRWPRDLGRHQDIQGPVGVVVTRRTLVRFCRGPTLAAFSTRSEALPLSQDSERGSGLGHSGWGPRPGSAGALEGTPAVTSASAGLTCPGGRPGGREAGPAGGGVHLRPRQTRQ